MTTDKVPNFFLLGAPKSGTSAMAYYLASHPEVYFSNPKEPGFFDRDLRFPDRRQCAYGSVDDYLRLYESADPLQHKAIGEGSVYMMYSREIVARILQLSPNAKFVLMLRNPYEAAVSMHGENLKSAGLGREPKENFGDAWTDLANRNVDELSGVHPMRFRYDVLFSYNEHVASVIDAVGSDRVKVIIYDDFRADNVGVAQDLFRFLGISDRFEPDATVLNRRSQSRDNMVARTVFWAAKQARKSRLLRPLRGKGLTLNRFTQKSLPKPELTSQLIEEMRLVYQGDIAALQGTLGRDLSTWLETDVSTFS